jgi:fluoride exporter
MSLRVVLPVVSVGGVLGALARYGLGVAWPHPAAGFPWATWVINVSGCFLIGVLMTWLARRAPRHPYLRPFFGVGFLGGYTTFSTAMVDALRAPPAVGLLYFFATVAGALLAVWAGSAVASR